MTATPACWCSAASPAGAQAPGRHSGYALDEAGAELDRIELVRN